MQESFRAFAQGLIDYAGMFPPAKLPLAEALANYIRYREQGEAWMLGRFICPAQRLAEITTPTPISALGRGGAPASFEFGLPADLDDIARFHDRIGPLGRVEVLEIRLPIDAEPLPVPGFRVFYEASSTDEIERTIRAIADLDPGGIGFKLRCGGVTSDAFPSSDRVAFAIDLCRRTGVPFKATAGLHHPVRSFREEVGARMHGFVNVFGAALLAHAHDLGIDRILPILEEEDPAAFRFTLVGFAWRDLKIGTERIRALRQRMVTSFGSCSFDEPREDLRVLGFLPARG